MSKAALTTRHCSLTAISMFLKDGKKLVLSFGDEYKNCVKWRFPPKFAKN